MSKTRFNPKARAPFEVPVHSKYGAPMGRRADSPSDFAGVAHVKLRRVPMVDGAYDPGGAYWGMGVPLWCAWYDSEDARDGSLLGQLVAYVRAPSRQAAKSQFPSSVKWAR